MPSIKDIVAGQSVGIGKRVIKAGADKLRGIINDRGLVVICQLSVLLMLKRV